MESNDYEEVEISNDLRLNDSSSSSSTHFTAGEATRDKACEAIVTSKKKSPPSNNAQRLPGFNVLAKASLVFTLLSNFTIVVSLVFVALVYAGDFTKDLPTKNSNSHSIFNSTLKLLEDEASLLQEKVASISDELAKQSKLVEFITTSRKVSSCMDILNENVSSPSDDYTLMLGSGKLKKVYCNMNITCGNITGGWMQVAQFDTQNCPPQMKTTVFDGMQTCVKDSDFPGCAPVIYHTFGIPYSRVCGKVRGFSIGTIDGFHFRRRSQMELFSNYLDGVSLTSNTNHVWSFAAGNCDCQTLPSFVQDDYTCDGRTCGLGEFCGDFLWNSAQCGRGTPFLKHLPNATTSDIVMRVCRDESRSNEDIAITEVEIYVQ